MVITRQKLISSLGEFGLIEFIKNNNTKAGRHHNVVLDIGDDCFGFSAVKNSKYVVTTDILIEDIHFKTKWATPEQIAKKAVEINVSDIASMGSAQPLYLFISMGIPQNTELSYVKRLFKTIKKNCDKYGIHIAGGDTVRADKLTISITLIGICKGNIVTRFGAKNSDIICVSGQFGDSGAGLDILLGKKKKLNSYEKKLIKKHLEPKARLDIANLMLKNNINITSMTDSSDGLFKSVELLTTDCNKGAVVYLDKVPVSKELIEFTKGNKDKKYHYILNGGEEFELVFTINPNDKTKLQKLIPAISYIGYIDKSKKIKYFEKNNKMGIKYNGYKHF
ncbi:MAG: thiamine-phosphate kinase [Endomicrobiaceae bacterium]|nr:thiamine-phosphate kinase [Endomicrobiaceae bacterium]